MCQAAAPYKASRHQFVKIIIGTRRRNWIQINGIMLYGVQDGQIALEHSFIKTIHQKIKTGENRPLSIINHSNKKS